MEHYRSTLATTAVAVCGLLAAAHLLHPGNYENQPRAARPIAHARVVAVTAEAAQASAPWVDPPGALRGAEPAALMAGSAAVLAPRLTVAPPAGSRMTPPLASTLTAPAAPNVAALGVAALGRDVATSSAGAGARGSDPLAGLLRDLGLGRDGEG